MCVKDFVNLSKQLEDTDFVKHYRINKGVLRYLCEKYNNYLTDYVSNLGTGGRPAICGEKKLLVYLWFVGHESASFRDVSNRFDISLSTLHEIITDISEFICSLAPEVIRWPNDERQQETMFFLRNKGFPGVIGLIDGTHIRIDKIKEDSTAYYNRKSYYSIQMQAICNEQKKLIDIFIGYPGSVHDARVFENSDIYTKIVNLPNNRWILGDSAYPCMKHLLTPYRDNGHLTPIQINFNKKLSSCRVLIEHTIGILKQRFRVLYHIKLHNPSSIVKLIKACCVLHNLCDSSEIDLLEEPLDGDESPNIPTENDENDGKQQRDEVAMYLFTVHT